MKRVFSFAFNVGTRYIVSLRFLLISALFVFSSNPARSQCTNQVTHMHGTKMINGVNVTVTYTGVVDSDFVYCPSTVPYFIGYRYAGGQNGDGSYLFTFSPPVSAITVNVSGISNIPGSGIEEVKLKKNGVHYSIPAAGITDGCDPMAVLTSEGNIAGCLNCGVSGWSQTTVSGPLTSIEVKDSVLYGNPEGSIFSLFICDIATNVDEIKSDVLIKIFPNPFVNTLNLSSTSDKLLQFILYDIVSRKLLQQNFTGSSSLNTEQFPKGIYLYEIKDKNNTIREGKIIKE